MPRKKHLKHSRLRWRNWLNTSSTTISMKKQGIFPRGNGILSGNRVYIHQGLGHGVFEEAKDFHDRVYEFCESGGYEP